MVQEKKIKIQGKQFTDVSGSPFIPKGINMVCKEKERNYTGDYTDEDFAFLKEHGFNLIRLGLQWCAAEPAPGVYSEEYFSGIDKIIARAASHDIPVFLDMHQDLFGEKFEDGAPVWATLDKGAEHIRTELWSESYLLSPAVQTAFDSFWADETASDGVGIRTHFVNLWKYIAGRYGKDPYVIGYDLFNEPFPGTAGAKVGQIMAEFSNGGTDLSAFEDEDAVMRLIGSIAPIAAGFEENSLNPFYDEAAAAIREVDPETIIILESCYFANAGIPSVIRPALDSFGKPFANQAYAPHCYDILVDTADYGQGGTERIDLIFSVLFEKAKALDIPMFIGEWGCYPDAGEPQKAQAKHLLSLFEQAGIGQVYFDHSHIKDGGIIEVLR